VLYIEADEDHAASRDGNKLEVPLVYVHEGRDLKGTRRYLKNAHYFSGLYTQAEELWYEVLNYIDSNYDLDKVEQIYLAGDGAKWVRLGTKIIPKSSFILDRYHLAKYILTALGKGNEYSRRIWAAIRGGELEEVKSVLKEAYKRAETQGRRNAIKKCRKYIVGNWDGIKVYQTHASDVIGCSAEGHMSHILSARLSSRPMGWSRDGVDQMARIRVLKANGINIKELYLKQAAEPATILEVCQTKVQQQRKMLKEPPFEMIGNIPALKGPTGSIAHIIRALKSA